MLQVNLTPGLESKITAFAHGAGKPVDVFVLHAIEAFIEDMEDVADAEAVLSKRERVWTHEEVKRAVSV